MQSEDCLSGISKDIWVSTFLHFLIITANYPSFLILRFNFNLDQPIIWWFDPPMRRHNFNADQISLRTRPICIGPIDFYEKYVLMGGLHISAWFVSNTFFLVYFFYFYFLYYVFPRFSANLKRTGRDRFVAIDVHFISIHWPLIRPDIASFEVSTDNAINPSKLSPR